MNNPLDDIEKNLWDMSGSVQFARLFSVKITVLLITLSMIIIPSTNLISSAAAQGAGQTNLSENDGESSRPQIVTLANNGPDGVQETEDDNFEVYVVWQDYTELSSGSASLTQDIFFRKSSDGGATFGSIINLSDNDGDSVNPRIAVIPNSGMDGIPGNSDDSSNLYVIWQDNTDPLTNAAGIVNSIFFASSADGGETFGSATAISDNFVGDATNPQLAVTPNQGPDGIPGNSDDSVNVHAVWDFFVFLDNFNWIYFAYSTDGGVSWNSNIQVSDLADSFGTANPQIAAVQNSGPDGVPGNSDDSSNVYIVFRGIDLDSLSSRAIFAVSQDSGASGFTITTLNSRPTDAPRLAAFGSSNVILVWEEFDDITGDYHVFTAASTDSGSSFITAEPTSTSPSASTGLLPQIAAVWNNGPNDNDDTDDNSSNVYVAWKSTDASFTTTIRFARSTDGGLGYDTPIQLSTDNSDNPVIAVTEDGANVYVGWENSLVTSKEVYVVRSTDGGQSFTDPTNVSDSSDSDSLSPQIALSSLASGEHHISIVWSDAGDILFAQDPDFLQQSISITVATPTANPRWDLDEITLSGTTAGAGTDYSVTIEWGDEPEDGIEISPEGLWSSSHTYGISSASSDPIQVVAKLVDENGITKASSSPLSITVRGHQTAIALSVTGAVVAGMDVQVIARLTDIEAAGSPVISGKSIQFSGNGSANLSIAVTNATGYATSEGASPEDVSDFMAVLAQFAGDDAYQSSVSNAVTYDTVDPELADQVVDVLAGTLVEVPIPSTFGLVSSIDFDNVAMAGKLYYSTCETPTNARYTGTDTCVRLSSSAILAPSSFAHIHVPLPPDFSAAEVNVFHEISPTIFADITEPKSDDDATITGKTSGFSKFVIGVPEYSPKPANAVRQEIFVGNDQEASIRFIEGPPQNMTATYSLDKTSYVIGDTVTLTITDPEANLDSNEVTSVPVRINSTGDPAGILLTLPETTASSGAFTGSFMISNTTSSSENILFVTGPGDVFRILYNASHGRLKAVFDGVNQTGIVQLSDFEREADLGFGPVGEAIDLSLEGAQIGSDGNITVTMSYANVYLNGADPEAFRLYHQLSEGVWEEVTLRNSTGHIVGVDTDMMTVTGITTSAGAFTVGFETSGGGGGGGGLGLPGAGVVLDFIAPIGTASLPSDGDDSSTSSQTGGKRGSRGTQSGTLTRQVLEGSDVEVTASTSTGGLIEINFETIGSPGLLTIKENPNISDYANVFDSIEQNRGNIIIESSNARSQYTTVGSIFEVTVSSIMNYSGKIWVTMPYDETLIPAVSEDNIRILHYNIEGGAGGGPTRGAPVQGDQGLGGWEDVTAHIDTENNTITGLFGSLSPIALATVEDGTFNDLYFELNPLRKMLVSEASLTGRGEAGQAALEKGQQLTISSSLQNIQRNSQDFVFIVQILDEQGVVTSINRQSGILEKGQATAPSIEWTAEESGIYTIQIFVWDSIADADNHAPRPLSSTVAEKIAISEHQ